MQNTYETLKVDVDASLIDRRKEIELCEENIKSLNDIVDISSTYMLVALLHSELPQV